MAGRHARGVERRKRTTESSEYAAMLLRMIYGYGYRVGQAAEAQNLAASGRPEGLAEPVPG